MDHRVGLEGCGGDAEVEGALERAVLTAPMASCKLRLPGSSESPSSSAACASSYCSKRKSAKPCSNKFI